MFSRSLHRLRPAVQLYSNLRICSVSSIVYPAPHCYSRLSCVQPAFHRDIGVISASGSSGVCTRTYKTASVLYKNPLPPNCIVQDGVEHTSIHSEHDFESLAEETLESLADYFLELPEVHEMSPDYDASYADGVLTIKLGSDFGTYVLNKQTPNRQIWLSSPVSGPKRYDFICDQWVYKRDGVTLHDMMSTEISLVLNVIVDLRECAYGNVISL